MGVTGLILGAITLFMQAGAPIVTPPNNSTTTVHQDISVQVQVPPPDPEATSQMANWSFQGIVVSSITPTLAKWANDALNIPDIYRTTPANLTYDNGEIKTMTNVVRLTSIGLMAIVIAVWGISALFGQHQNPGRPFLAALLAAGNLVWWKLLIDGNNAVCAAISAPEIKSFAAQHLTVPALSGDPAEAFAPALLVIAYAIVLLLLIVAMVFRLAMIDILIVAGPLFLIAKGNEATEHFTSTYWNMALGTLLGQIAVVICLKLAPILGLGAGGFASALISLAILMLARRMPGLLSSRFNQGGGSTMRLALLVGLRRLVARI